MEKEQVAVDEAVETVAEENARAYSKTVWNESTPITADKLNKMETGIANGIDKTEQIMTIPIASSQGWQQFRWTMPNQTTVSWTRDAPGKKALEIFDETEHKPILLLKDDGNLTTSGSITLPNSTKGQIKQTLTTGVATPTLYITNNNNLRVGSADIENVCIYTKTNPKTSVNGSTYTLFHTGNFNPDTKLNAGAFSINNRDLLIHGKRALVGFNTGDGDYLTINHERDFGAGIKIYGLTRTDAIENGGKLTFYNQMGGGQMSSLINCQELQNNTGNGQMMTAYNNTIYVGNPNTQLYLESLNNPILVRNGVDFTLYHTGNKPTANDVGALPIGGGTLTGVLSVSGNSKSISMGTGPGDVFISSSRSGKYLQLKDDGTLSYDDKKIYHEGNKPTAAAIGAMPTSSPTFEGNLFQNGPGGKDWIYHINADRGTLNIAPRNNGNPDWGKQIFIDRNGQLHCNGNRRVATINQENPAHHIIRYGAGMGGENGYITFSW